MQEVIDEVKNNRQIKSLAVLPYQLQIKEADPESVKVITDFAKQILLPVCSAINWFVSPTSVDFEQVAILGIFIEKQNVPSHAKVDGEWSLVFNELAH